MVAKVECAFSGIFVSLCLSDGCRSPSFWSPLSFIGAALLFAP